MFNLPVSSSTPTPTARRRRRPAWHYRRSSRDVCQLPASRRGQMNKSSRFVLIHFLAPFLAVSAVLSADNPAATVKSISGDCSELNVSYNWIRPRDWRILAFEGCSYDYLFYDGGNVGGNGAERGRRPLRSRADRPSSARSYTTPLTGPWGLQ